MKHLDSLHFEGVEVLTDQDIVEISAAVVELLDSSVTAVWMSLKRLPNRTRWDGEYSTKGIQWLKPECSTSIVTTERRTSG
jgi:hypothetical protein